MAGTKYQLGVAFSGGGAKAAAHCGALQALKEFGLRPDIVAGTSAGSLVAVLYASGFTPAGMIQQMIIPTAIKIDGNAYDDFYAGRR